MRTDLLKRAKRRLVYLIEHIWTESPWIRSAGIIGGALVGLTFLHSQLPPEVAIDLRSPQTVELILLAVLISYFFLAAVFSGDRLRFEKKLRELEQHFRYDKRGTLFNGSEPNIAFRINTFKSILESLSPESEPAQLHDRMRAAGSAASADFARTFHDIYDHEITHERIGRKWNDLSLPAKLEQWAQYDSSTGWGIIWVGIKGYLITLQITHLHGLYSGQGGVLFGAFLQGYCQTVISEIVKSQEGGKFHDCEAAIPEEITHLDENKLQLVYSLK